MMREPQNMTRMVEIVVGCGFFFAVLTVIGAIASLIR